MQYSEGLKKNRDFTVVYENGKAKSDAVMVVYAMPNNKEINRLGVVVSKKVGNSVVRHHLKRLVKENYRLNESSYLKGRDIIVIMRRGSGEADFYKIGASLNKLSRNLGILVPNENS